MIEQLIRDSERLNIVTDFVKNNDSNYIEKSTLLILLGATPKKPQGHQQEEAE